MRKHFYFSFTSIIALAVMAVPTFAASTRQSATLSTPGTTRTLTLPAQADHSPVISLGVAQDPQSGDIVEGYAIVHYKNNARPGGGSSRGPTCYGYLASGAKWRVVEPWVVNAENTRGLDGAYVFSNLVSDIAKWEDAADGILGNATGANVLGDGSLTDVVLAADMAAPDNVNEVYFADVSDSGAIAVTIVWGVFSGPPQTRKLVEWDQVYDDVDFDWSASGEAGRMDFENIATHELGHSVGMGDLYDAGCASETMYGYATEGETSKRSLNAGDIKGLNNLY